MLKHYGITQNHLQSCRTGMAHGASFDYCMAQLAQTYRTRKVMYDTPNRSLSVNWVHANIDRVP